MPHQPRSSPTPLSCLPRPAVEQDVLRRVQASIQTVNDPRRIRTGTELQMNDELLLAVDHPLLEGIVADLGGGLEERGREGLRRAHDRTGPPARRARVEQRGT